MPVERKHCQCPDTQIHFLERAFESLQLAPAQRELLLSSFRETTISIPLRSHDAEGGELRTYTGYRVQHNHARGPFKGGLRFHQSVSLGEIRALAQLMTWKTALVGNKGFISGPYGPFVRALRQGGCHRSDNEITGLPASYDRCY